MREILQDYFADIEMRTYGVSSYAELVAALADTTITDIYLLTGITLTGTLLFAHKVALHGQGYALTDASLDASQYMAAQVSAAGCLIEDVIWAISGNSDGNALYSIDVGAPQCTIQNCTFVMANAGDSGSVSVYYEGYGNQKINGNTLSNGIALTGGAVGSASQLIMVEVKGNTFAATKGIGLGLATVGGINYIADVAATLALIKAYLIAEGNTTTGDATGLNVENYL